MLEVDFGTNDTGTDLRCCTPWCAKHNTCPQCLPIQLKLMYTTLQDKEKLLSEGKGTRSKPQPNPTSSSRSQIGSDLLASAPWLMRQCKGCSTADGRAEHQCLGWEIDARGCRLQRHRAGRSPAPTSNRIPVRVMFNRDKGISSRSFPHSLMPEPLVALISSLELIWTLWEQYAWPKSTWHQWDSLSRKLREDSLNTKQLLRIPQTSPVSFQGWLLSLCPVHTTQFSAVFVYTLAIPVCSQQHGSIWLSIQLRGTKDTIYAFKERNLYCRNSFHAVCTTACPSDHQIPTSRNFIFPQTDRRLRDN